jgi:hypothetical protein
MCRPFCPSPIRPALFDGGCDIRNCKVLEVEKKSIEGDKVRELRKGEGESARVERGHGMAHHTQKQTNKTNTHTRTHDGGAWSRYGSKARDVMALGSAAADVMHSPLHVSHALAVARHTPHALAVARHTPVCSVASGAICQIRRAAWAGLLEA